MPKKKKNSKIVMVDERRKAETGYRKTKTKARSAQDTVPFDECYENGLFRNGETFSIIFSFENVDYKVMRDNEKDMFYEKYIHFLNTLPQDIHYQELIMNYPTDKQQLENAIVPKDGAQICSRSVFRDYRNVMERLIDRAAVQSCEQVIIPAMSFTPKTKLDDVSILFKYFKALQDEALNFGVKVTQMMPQESFEKLHHLYHMSDKESFLMPTNYLQADVNLKDYIVPSSFTFKSKYIETGSAYSCVMFARRFSYECDDEFVTDLLDNTYDIAVSKHLVRMDKTDALKILKRQMDDHEARMEKRRELNAKRGGAYIPYNLRQREKDLTNLQEKLGSSNCDLFTFALYIYISANTLEELNDLRDYIKQTALRHQVVVDVLTGVPQQEAGLQSILPFANPSKTKDGGLLGQPFYLLSDEVGNFIPFSYRNDINPAGLIYGTNLITNTPIIIDRTDELNANGFFLGTSGSGKSVFTKSEFFAAAMKYTNDEFIIIDPENEYRPLAVSSDGSAPPFDAEIVKLSPNTDTYINIFDTDMTYSEEGASAVQLKVDFIMTFCEVVKGSELTAKERSVIDRCTKTVYRDYVQSNGDRSKLPTLNDFYNTLTQQEEKEAADIALALESYVTGSFNIFAHDTNIQYNKKFIIFDIFEMGNQLQTVGLMVLLEILWQRVIQNKLRGVRTWVWTDEFSIMFNDDRSGIFRTGDFFEKVYKRIRKHGGVATGATQNISEVIKSNQAMNMLQNSEFLVFLAQKEDDLEIIKSRFRLSENQAKYLDVDEPGKGLIKCGKRIIPFSNLIPDDSLMYRICTTKFKDIQARLKAGDMNESAYYSG